MKHYILPVLIWTLATSQIFAQKPLPPSAQRSMAQWPVSVLALMQNAGYNPKTLSLPAAAASRSNPLQLDSTKSFQYTLNGALDSTPLLRSIFQYPQTGLVVETQSQWNGNDWTPLTRTETTLDAQARIRRMTIAAYDLATQAFQPGSKLELFPRGNSQTLVDSVKAFLWDEDLNDWAFAFQLTNTFDAQDRLLTAETSFEAAGQITLMVDQYSYDGNGDNHLTESFLINNGFSLPTGKEEMMYLNHLLVQTISFAPNGFGVLAPTDRVTNAYNPSKLLAQQNSYTWVPGVNDWNPTLNQTFEYDNAKRLSVQTTEFLQGGQKERVTYEYVEDENLARENRSSWNAAMNTYVLHERKYYYYAAEASAVLPTPHTVQNLVLSPNPTLGEVQFSLDVAVEVRVFNAAGQVLQSRTLQPGESLNLSTLPAGIYPIMAHNNQDCFTGKLVKQ